MKRITALDMLRGYALAAIMIDHMPGGFLRDYTLANFAVFDAAELFVLLSGFLVGLVWVTIESRDGRRAAQLRFLRRAAQVWLALVVGGIMLALLSRLLFTLGMEHTAVWSEYARWVVEHPVGYLVTLSTLWMQPNLLDVLALYVVVLAFAPLTVPVLLRYPWVFAIASAGLWAVSVPLNQMLPNHRSSGGMLFNPFAWQALFHAGVAMCAFRQQIMPVLRRHSTALTIICSVIVIYSFALAQFWRYGPELKEFWRIIREPIMPIDKWSLDGMRFTAILAASWLVAVPLAPLFAWLAGTWPGRALAVIGRGGLVSFVACVMLSVLGDALMTLPGGATDMFRLSVEIWTLGVLWLVAEIEKRRSRNRRSAVRPAGQ
ncbi:OpgC domain-containing protein [Paracoccus aerodenitrificans]|uniref:OpgC domain-containing protein n=1 Tax=Paracoccus aerodenitrificans TaxID=3017781 RepID=UPI0022F063CD|nr:OpgC domain-containing protein [Paracoccus aerodenitrificans]WBU63023.1 OpgC domain-containing protein [Paracoccus aerodenitrificans]